jgi:hypothetical protein
VITYANKITPYLAAKVAKQIYFAIAVALQIACASAIIGSRSLKQLLFASNSSLEMVFKYFNNNPFFMKNLNSIKNKVFSPKETKIRLFTQFALLLLFTQLFSYKINAQTNACGCTPVTTTEFFIYVSECKDPITGNHCPADPTNTGCTCGDPESYIILEYTKVTCGNDVGIMLSKETFVGPNYNTPTTGQPTVPGSSAYNIATDIIYARQKLIENIGLATLPWLPNNFSFVYPAGCKALAQVVYPAPALCYYRFSEGPNAGQIRAVVDLSKDPVIELLACEGDNCCKMNYNYDWVKNKIKFVSFQEIINCNVPPPTVSTQDFTCPDINGNPVTYTGQVQVTGKCESYCNGDMSLLFKTSGTKNYVPLPNPMDFSITPIPAKDFITFSTLENIAKIEIFSNDGKLVDHKTELKSNSLDISKISKGIYYVRVYSNDPSIRSIKIVKE